MEQFQVSIRFQDISMEVRSEISLENGGIIQAENKPSERDFRETLRFLNGGIFNSHQALMKMEVQVNIPAGERCYPENYPWLRLLDLGTIDILGQIIIVRGLSHAL